jgi:hypothetical protein
VPHYTFRLWGDDADVHDDEGVVLSTYDAAFRYAHDVAREIMNHREAKTRHWCLDIYAEGKKIGEIPFVGAAQTVDDVRALAKIGYSSHQVRAKDVVFALNNPRQGIEQ